MFDYISIHLYFLIFPIVNIGSFVTIEVSLFKMCVCPLRVSCKHPRIREFFASFLQIIFSLRDEQKETHMLASHRQHFLCRFSPTLSLKLCSGTHMDLLVLFLWLSFFLSVYCFVLFWFGFCCCLVFRSLFVF